MNDPQLNLENIFYKQLDIKLSALMMNTLDQVKNLDIVFCLYLPKTHITMLIRL